MNGTKPQAINTIDANHRPIYRSPEEITMTQTPKSAVGIDDIAVHVPKLFISTLGEFARARGIEPAKLARGIGVEKMAVPDAHEDAATMAASSVLELMRKSDISGPSPASTKRRRSGHTSSGCWSGFTARDPSRSAPPSSSSQPA
jgi:hypothetical protein